MNTTNKIQAMSIESPATPDAPSAKAMSAITKNVSAQLNMMHLPFSDSG
jgi:hypothetical protein